MERKKTSISIDPNVWKRAKKYCIDSDKDLSEYIEEILVVDLKKKGA